jgi:hypothetical protein
VAYFIAIQTFPWKEQGKPQKNITAGDPAGIPTYYLANARHLP